MLALHTAKILLFIAMNLGPQNPPMIYATSNSDSYVWTRTEAGWMVEKKCFPSSDFTRDPSQFVSFSGQPSAASMPAYLRVIATHQWKRHSAMVFDNGDRVEKHGDHAFYIVDAGGANEKVYTILFPTSK